MIENDTPTPRVTNSRRISATGWSLLAFAAILAGALALTGWNDAGHAILTLGPFKLVALSCFALGHYLVRALRWHLMVRVGGVNTSLRLNTLHFFGGFAMTATPGRVGELVRLRWLMRATGKGIGKLLPIAFADRAIELASIVSLIAAALLLSNLSSRPVLLILAVGLVIVWVACRPSAFLAVVYGSYRITGRRMHGFSLNSAD